MVEPAGDRAAPAAPGMDDRVTASQPEVAPPGRLGPQGRATRRSHAPNAGATPGLSRAAPVRQVEEAGRTPMAARRVGAAHRGPRTASRAGAEPRDARPAEHDHRPVPPPVGVRTGMRPPAVGVPPPARRLPAAGVEPGLASPGRQLVNAVRGRTSAPTTDGHVPPAPGTVDGGPRRPGRPPIGLARRPMAVPNADRAGMVVGTGDRVRNREATGDRGMIVVTRRVHHGRSPRSAGSTPGGATSPGSRCTPGWHRSRMNPRPRRVWICGSCRVASAPNCGA